MTEADRDALLKDMAAELGQHEVVGPSLLNRIISEVHRRYDVADQRRSKLSSCKTLIGRSPKERAHLKPGSPPPATPLSTRAPGHSAIGIRKRPTLPLADPYPDGLPNEAPLEWVLPALDSTF
jgi:hypothetical protein